MISPATASSVPTHPVITATSMPTATPSPDFLSTSASFMLTLLSTRYLTSTPTLSATPSPTVARFESKPDCTPGPIYNRCYDPVLSLSFEYPSQWGEITASLRNTLGKPVFAYNYAFTNPNRLDIRAGGRGKGIIEGRGGTITDFWGFDEPFPGACAYEGIFYCEEILPQVILEIFASHAEEVCQPAPGVEPYPIMIVKIDLPENPTINGFLLASEFLSHTLKQELDEILGYSHETGFFTKCDLENRQRYDAKISEIIAGVITGSAEPITQENFVTLLHLANSIIFDGYSASL